MGDALLGPAASPLGTWGWLSPHILGRGMHRAAPLPQSSAKPSGGSATSVISTLFFLPSPSSFANADMTGGCPRRGVLQLLPAPEIILPYLHPLRLPERNG